MTDKELIKQEIERLKHNTPNAYDLSRFMLLEEIESFINSLPEKFGCEVNFTTKNEDLVEEVDNFLKDPVFGKLINRNAGIALASHFAEWQKQNMKEALQTEYEKGRFDMRKEMMKDAVDATIFSELKGSDGSLFQAKSDRFRMNGVKISDRIKVIPIKTEKQ